MNIKANLTISRPAWGDGRTAISIKVGDDASRIEFLAIEIPLADFAEALTGLSKVECDAEVRGLENVGLTRESKQIEFLVGDVDVDWDRREENICRLAEEATPEGWNPPTYFGSRGSFFDRDGERWARGYAERWV